MNHPTDDSSVKFIIISFNTFANPPHTPSHTSSLIVFRRLSSPHHHCCCWASPGGAIACGSIGNRSASTFHHFHCFGFCALCLFLCLRQHVRCPRCQQLPLPPNSHMNAYWKFLLLKSAHFFHLKPMHKLVIESIDQGHTHTQTDTRPLTRKCSVEPVKHSFWHQSFVPPVSEQVTKLRHFHSLTLTFCLKSDISMISMTFREKATVAVVSWRSVDYMGGNVKHSLLCNPKICFLSVPFPHKHGLNPLFFMCSITSHLGKHNGRTWQQTRQRLAWQCLVNKKPTPAHQQVKLLLYKCKFTLLHYNITRPFVCFIPEWRKVINNHYHYHHHHRHSKPASGRAPMHSILIGKCLPGKTKWANSSTSFFSSIFLSP